MALFHLQQRTIPHLDSGPQASNQTMDRQLRTPLSLQRRLLQLHRLHLHQERTSPVARLMRPQTHLPPILHSRVPLHIHHTVLASVLADLSMDGEDQQRLPMVHLHNLSSRQIPQPQPGRPVKTLLHDHQMQEQAMLHKDLLSKLAHHLAQDQAALINSSALQSLLADLPPAPLELAAPTLQTQLAETQLRVQPLSQTKTALVALRMRAQLVACTVHRMVIV